MLSTSSARSSTHRISISGTAFSERRTVHEWGGPERIAAQFPFTAEFWRHQGIGTGLSVPIITTTGVQGVVSVGKISPEPYPSAHVRVVEALAAQAGIAIENARLFNELEQRNADLSATSDVLRIVGQFATDLSEVLNAVIARVGALVNADSGVVFLIENGTRRGFGEWSSPAWKRTYSGSASDGQPLTSTTPADRAVLKGARCTCGDGDEIRAEYPDAGVDEDEVTTRLAVPILRGDESVGGLLLARNDIRPFSDHEIALVESFADQAAIAIANSRLFKELKDTNEAARGRLPPQVRVPGQHVPRTADAAERHHRLQRAAHRGSGRPRR